MPTGVSMVCMDGTMLMTISDSDDGGGSPVFVLGCTDALEDRGWEGVASG